jgi:hypothetical protein
VSRSITARKQPDKASGGSQREVRSSMTGSVAFVQYGAAEFPDYVSHE